MYKCTNVHRELATPSVFSQEAHTTSAVANKINKNYDKQQEKIIIKKCSRKLARV